MAWKGGLKRKRSDVVPEDNDPYGFVHINMLKIFYPSNISLYRSQNQTIIAITNAMKNSENALIESPTGSGKTFALLTGACAYWLDYEEKRKKSRAECPVHAHKVVTTEAKPKGSPGADKKADNSNLSELGEMAIDGEATNDSTMFEELVAAEENAEKKEEAAKCTCLARMRIYYCSRTHQQIGQVVSQFKRLPYATLGIKHTVLASREQSCVNQDVRQQRGNLNEHCIELNSRSGLGCQYRDKLKSVLQQKTASGIRKDLATNTSEVWDIEDLVNKVTKTKLSVCPYYLTNREFTKDANIIFCPYNYLIDPVVRNSSDVILKNAIVIIDEGHNIEDVSRSAASIAITDYELATTIGSVRKCRADTEKFRSASAGDQPADENFMGMGLPDMEFLNAIYENAKMWEEYLVKFENLTKDLLPKVHKLKGDQRNQGLTLPSAELKRVLANVFLDANAEEFKKFRRAYEGLAGKGDAAFQNPTENVSNLMLKPISQALHCMEKLLYFFMFYSQPGNDAFYEGNLAINNGVPRFSTARKEGGGAQFDVMPVGLVSGCTVVFSFWSMMPSVAWKNAFADTRTVILASGTLTPIASFESELQTEFKYKVQGDQIISKDRILSAILPAGRSGRPLQLTYDQLKDRSVLDSMGGIILDTCQNIPKGVLCFVSNYRLLDDLFNQMENNGMMVQVKLHKAVFREPRESSQLPLFLSRYEEAIAAPKHGGNGALMFAVFRGKISEGTDFSDDSARAVICFGIPYASVMDPQVVQKKRFNDANRKTLGLVSSSEWYEIQAFRAINQALGRCLRHRMDWGALILVDTRLMERAAKISKWVVNCLQPFGSYNAFIDAVQQFVKRLQDVENVEQQPGANGTNSKAVVTLGTGPSGARRPKIE